METIKKLFWVSRPISWPNTAFPFAAGYVVTGGSFGWFLLVGAVFFLIPYNLLMYGVNDVFDYESDIKNPRKGGIEGMREQRSFHPTILKACLVVTLPFIAYLLIVGSILQNLTLILLLFFVVAYSLKGLRFKEIPLLDSLTSSIHFVGPLVYALTFTSFSGSSLVILAAFLLWGIASHALGAIQDIIPDRTGNISSIATVFGARNTLMLVAALYAIAALLMTTLGIYGVLVSFVGLLYILNLAPLRHVTDKTSGQANPAWRRFIWLNLFAGWIITMILIAQQTL